LIGSRGGSGHLCGERLKLLFIYFIIFYLLSPVPRLRIVASAMRLLVERQTMLLESLALQYE
jgi:hypothetical protein